MADYSSEEQTFKRLEYHYNSPLQLNSHPLSSLTSDLGPTEIIVKVEAASLNPVDIVLFNTHKYLFFKRNTKGFGRDFSGVVTHLGSDVVEFVKGDKIAGLYEPIYGGQGTVTEYLKLDLKENKQVGKIPSKLDFVESASFPLVFGTAYTLLTHHHKPGNRSRVLIIGGGTSVGWYVIQLLRNFYHVEYIATVNSSKSSPRVKALGVDDIIDYTTSDVATEVSRIVETTGKQFDLILDTVGDKSIFPIINKVLKPKSENSGYATIVGDQVADYRASAFAFFSWSSLFRFLFPSSYNYVVSGITNSTNWYELAVGLFDEGLLKTLIASVHPLEDYQAAINELIDHKAQGKVVIKVD